VTDGDLALTIRLPPARDLPVTLVHREDMLERPKPRAAMVTYTCPDRVRGGLRTFALAAVTLLLVAACDGDNDGRSMSPEENARLSALVLENVTLVPAFAPDTLAYTPTVANAVVETRVTPTTAEPGATVRVNGTAVASGATSAALPLIEGANPIEVVVTAANGTTIRTYTVTVTRRPPPSTNANLASLDLTVGLLDQLFDPAITDYTVGVGHLGTSTRAIALPEDAGATMTLNGALQLPGVPGSLVALAPGVNDLTLDVTAEDTTTMRAYEVAVTRGSITAVGQEAYVKPSVLDQDQFGTDLGFRGDTLAIGAPEEDSDATGIDNDPTDDSAAASGAVWLFAPGGSGWIETAYVKASNTDSGDAFGGAVAADGPLVVVGAPGEDSGADGVDGDEDSNASSTAGAAYAFERDAAGVWQQTAYLKASNSESGDEFGSRIGIDGDHVLVAAPFEDSNSPGVDGDEANNAFGQAGAAYLFGRDDTGDWLQLAYLKATNPGSEDDFGRALAISGDTIAVGAPGEDSRATGIDGNQDDNGAREAGAVYLYSVDAAGDWVPVAYVKASLPRAFDGFGAAVALDGALLAVGAPGQNSGASGVGGNNEDDQSMLDAGAVYIFERDVAGAWQQTEFLKASGPSEFDEFGSSVALCGNLLVVGAPGQNSGDTGINGIELDQSALNAGAVYVFERNGAGVWDQIAFVKASNTDTEDAFGTVVGCDRDAIVAGAPLEDSASTGVNGSGADNSLRSAGAVYVIR
jgi:hypothetical protein